MADTDAHEPDARVAELKRRRRELIAVGVASASLVAFVLAQTELPPLSSHTSLLSNLVVILLFDLSFLLLGLMLLLVGRNLAKAIFERRRGLIGSKLQARLVFGFIAVALVPSAFLLTWRARFCAPISIAGLIPNTSACSTIRWISPKSTISISANNAAHFARVLAGEIAAKDLLRPEQRADLTQVRREAPAGIQPRHDRGFRRDRKLLMLALSPQTPTGIGVSPDSGTAGADAGGHAMTRTDRFGKSDVIRGTAPIFVSPESDKVLGAMVVDYYLPRSLAKRAAGISQPSRITCSCASCASRSCTAICWRWC